MCSIMRTRYSGSANAMCCRVRSPALCSCRARPYQHAPALCQIIVETVDACCNNILRFHWHKITTTSCHCTQKLPMLLDNGLRLSRNANFSGSMFAFKALITLNVLQHNNPMYLRDLLTTHNPSRNLRSSSQHLLSVGYMRTASSSHCFKHSAAYKLERSAVWHSSLRLC